MNRREFGRLLAALRKSKVDDNMQPLTQRRLAGLAGISEQVLGNIERGDKVSLDRHILSRLSDALDLPTRERRKFFLAATGISEGESSHPDGLLALDELLRRLLKISLPAFIVDSYDDIVAANSIILRMFDFSRELIETAPLIPGGYNVLRFVFSQKSQFSRLVTKNHENYLEQSIRFFRAISLPYRATPYYQNLISAFHADPDMGLFSEYFYRVNQDKKSDYYFEGEHFCISHAALGNLEFYSPPLSPVHTSSGSLYIIPYLPANPRTTKACALLAEHGEPNVQRLALWPEKPAYQDYRWVFDANLPKSEDLNLETHKMP
jgi:transcriptional regulator with XRE-family HTH domain